MLKKKKSSNDYRAQGVAQGTTPYEAEVTSSNPLSPFHCVDMLKKKKKKRKK
jgi:hypothetical protein